VPDRAKRKAGEDVIAYVVWALLLLTIVLVVVYSVTKDGMIGWMMKASFGAFLIALVVLAFLWVIPGGPLAPPAPVIVR
jgi:uncharacterized BrkB/YihY/UPF0761 family membrane protein